MAKTDMQMIKYKPYYLTRSDSNRGFIAFTSSFILVFSLFYFCLIMLQSCYQIYDISKRVEYRIQGQINTNFCLDYARSVISRDYLVSGYHDFAFGCSLFFVRNGDAVNVEASTTISDIVFTGKRVYHIENYQIK